MGHSWLRGTQMGPVLCRLPIEYSKWRWSCHVVSCIEDNTLQQGSSFPFQKSLFFFFNSLSPSFNTMKQSSWWGLHRAGATHPWEPLTCLLSHLTVKSSAPEDLVLLEQNMRLLWPCIYMLCRNCTCQPWGSVIPEASLKSSVTVWGCVWSGWSAS